MSMRIPKGKNLTILLVAVLLGGAYLYFGRGFHDSFNRSEIGDDWTVVDGEWRIQDGVLIGYSGSHESREIVLNRDLEPDYTVSCKVYVQKYELGGPEAQVILRFRDGTNYYFAGLGAYTYTAGVGKYVNGAASMVTGGGDSGYLGIATGKWYNLKAEIRGSHIKVYVDGELLCEADDSSHPEGKVGLRVIYGEAWFDDFHVR